MENKKEMIAPDVSVGADTEQPISKNTISSISENGGNIKSFEELQREMQLQSDPSYQIMARLKSFADAHGLCLLLVHHTRNCCC